VLDKAIAREGGVWNAMTHLDWTTYFEIMPSEKIDLALRLEADRMVNSCFIEEEVESERSVIISERQGNENDPLFRLSEAVHAAAYEVHPYHHEIIGAMADLQTIQCSDLYQHYRSYYYPGNAVLSVAGDFDAEAMLNRITELFAPIPAGCASQQPVYAEPPQLNERQIVVEGPGETTYTQLVYHIPQANHVDFFACIVLGSLLTGPSSLNMFGSGISNKTSRLYRALVERELAVSVFGGLQATVDPYVYSILMTVRPDRDALALVNSLDDEIDRLRSTPPPAGEVGRAVKQARALFAYGSESISNLASWLGFSEMFATYEWFDACLDNLAAVTPAQVQRAAQEYLSPQNRVVGIYRPQGALSRKQA
jgi:zinc protease